MCVCQGTATRTHFLLHRDPQTHKCLQSWRVCVYARCTDYCFLDVYGRFFSWILSQHSSWSTFLQLLGVQHVASACPTSLLLLLSISHYSFLNLNSKWQGSKDLSGKVVCSSDLRASVCLSGGCSSFPGVFPVMFQCISVSCKHFRNFQSPQLKRAEFRGLLFCVCDHEEGEFTVHT